MLTTAVEAAVLVLIVNVAVVCPAGTVTLVAGSVTTLEFSASVTTAPPAGAAALSSTVPVDEAPPTMGLGANDTKARIGNNVMSAFAVTPLKTAEIRTDVVAGTELVVIVNVALDAPAGTITFAGTEAAPGALLNSETVAPPAGAAVFMVTVPADGDPPVRSTGLTARPVMASGPTGGVIFRSAVGPGEVAPWTRAPRPRLNVPSDTVRGAVEMVKAPLVAPAGTVMLAGRLATVEGKG